jgi:hypothetical protein
MRKGAVVIVTPVYLTTRVIPGRNPDNDIFLRKAEILAIIIGVRNSITIGALRRDAAEGALES